MNSELDYTMDRENVIANIVNGDFTNNEFIKGLLLAAREEPDDLVRSYARCALQEKSISILERLLAVK